MKTIQIQFTFLLFLFSTAFLFGQESAPGVHRFEIAKISVVGNTHSETQAILSRSGLQIGKSIDLPGQTIPRAIKALWKMQLFTDVKILQEKEANDLVYLKIVVKEAPRLGNFSITGIKKTQIEELTKSIGQHLQSGSVLNPHKKKISRSILQEYFVEKGFSEVKINLQEIPSLRIADSHDLIFDIQKGSKTKVQQIAFRGNKVVKKGKLLKLMSTKQKGRSLKASKLINAQLAEDLQIITQYYYSLGYRDAVVQKDSVWNNKEGHYEMLIDIAEGQQFYIGDISWRGNSIYTTTDLEKVFGLKKGDVFDPGLVESRLRFDQNGRDISSLYLDQGYLFFQIEALEKAIHDNVIDLEIRIQEGTQASIGKVTINGNTVTNEEVIRRELRTKPGDKFSRAALIRSQRTLVNMGYFNPEKIDIQTPVDAKNGSVDIEYNLEEKNSDQLELAASWGGPGIGLTGTAGVSFNNFSLRNLLNFSTWNPLPSGDGQRLSLRAQSNGKDYQSYNISFTEPWLGGKKPQAFSFSAFYNIDNEDGIDSEIDGEKFTVFGATTSLSRRLQWPDDNFISTTAINFQRYRLTDWGDDLFRPDDGSSINNGVFNKISLNQTIARSTINHPFFPTSGSRISLAMEFTPPYSLFRKEGDPDQSPEDQYKWIEYHKWRFDAELYKRIAGKLVLKASAKIGLLGAYNGSNGLSPFERFQLGGNGLSSFNNGYSGTDIISLRGYDVKDLENNIINGETVATPLFNKFSLELRYPVLTHSAANIFVLGFIEGGNSYQSLKDYNPLDLKRSAGLGLRAQIPMIGIIGFDYGLGFDKTGPSTIQNFGKLSLIFGFEPE